MHGFIAPTDHRWYQFLLARPEISEVNFWKPSGRRFGAIRAGEPFFFKLRAPYNAIGGFGLFTRFAALPVWHTWDVFGQANGTRDEYELLERVGRLAPADELRAQFEATQQLSDDEKQTVKRVLEGLLLAHEAKRWAA